MNIDQIELVKPFKLVKILYISMQSTKPDVLQTMDVLRSSKKTILMDVMNFEEAINHFFSYTFLSNALMKKTKKSQIVQFTFLLGISLLVELLTGEKNDLITKQYMYVKFAISYHLGPFEVYKRQFSFLTGRLKTIGLDWICAFITHTECAIYNDNDNY